MFVAEHARTGTPRTLRALLGFHVARGDIAAALHALDHSGAPLRAVAAGTLATWREALRGRLERPAVAESCGGPDDWPCGPKEACDCAVSDADPLLHARCLGRCRPRARRSCLASVDARPLTPRGLRVVGRRWRGDVPVPRWPNG
jgi:hypothetical protein